MEKIKPLPQQTLKVDHVHHNQTLLLVLLFTQGKIWILLIFGSCFLISTIFVVLQTVSADANKSKSAIFNLNQLVMASCLQHKPDI